MIWVKRIGIGIGALVVLAVAAVGILLWVLHEPRPESVVSPAADELARSMIAAVDGEAWERTGAIGWNFGGRRSHLWDKERQLDRFESGDLVVLLDLKTQRGSATRGGDPLEGAALDAALEQAWSAWCNDAFWLNPVVKAFDEGTTRGLVTTAEGRTGLMVSYESGGVTPGDSYLWFTGADGTPTAWKMWVSIIPFGGVDSTWEGWVTLPTGARVATVHQSSEIGITLRIEDLRAAATLAELEPVDPFAELVER